MWTVGSSTSTSASASISAAVTSPADSFEIRNVFDSPPCSLNGTCFKFKITSVASSTTPLIEENSCSTPSIFTAVTAAPSIEGVEHEFSSIKGVVEDATDVILNLKQVPFKLHSNEPKTLRINKEGAGEVTAADIEGDADVEILDPSVHIATVSDGGSLRAERGSRRGRGYVSADRNFDEDLSLGYIPIDSVHTPVK